MEGREEPTLQVTEREAGQGQRPGNWGPPEWPPSAPPGSRGRGGVAAEAGDRQEGRQDLGEAHSWHLDVLSGVPVGSSMWHTWEFVSWNGHSQDEVRGWPGSRKDSEAGQGSGCSGRRIYNSQEREWAAHPGPTVGSWGSRGLKVEGSGGQSFGGWTQKEGAAGTGSLQFLKRTHPAGHCYCSTISFLHLLVPRLSSAGTGQPWPQLALGCILGSSFWRNSVSHHLLSCCLAPRLLHTRAWTTFLPSSLWTWSSV